MARYLYGWTRAVLAELADGEWHDRGWVVAAACRVVPPGPAVRRAAGPARAATVGEWASAREAAGHYPWASGARMTVQDTVRGMVRSGTLEQRGQGLRDEIRLTPGKKPPQHNG